MLSAPNVYTGPTTPMTDPPTAAECDTDAAATAGMGTAAKSIKIERRQKNLSVTIILDRLVNC